MQHLLRGERWTKPISIPALVALELEQRKREAIKKIKEGSAEWRDG